MDSRYAKITVHTRYDWVSEYKIRTPQYYYRPDDYLQFTKLYSKDILYVKYDYVQRAMRGGTESHCTFILEKEGCV